MRKIIRIDEEKCNGCALCADVCHEGAIDIVNGKAKLIRENFCDGLGDCLLSCPANAISIEEREAMEYDEAAVKAAKEDKQGGKGMVDNAAHAGGCPGSNVIQFKRDKANEEPKQEKSAVRKQISRLLQWPCQIKLVPVQAPFFDGARLLIAADCTAYAYANMHEEFMKDKITIIGCPKLDEVDYAGKLTAIIRDNDVKSITVVRMEVPCCGGLQRAVENALIASGKLISCKVVTVSRSGEIIE